MAAPPPIDVAPAGAAPAHTGGCGFPKHLGTQMGPPPQHVRAHAKPGGHCDDVWHGVASPQKTASWQKQQPSTVMTHPQQLPQVGWPLQAKHPPAWIQTWGSVSAAAPAVDEVTIDPAPTTAAPTPARLSSFLLETRISVASGLRMAMTSVSSARGFRLRSSSTAAGSGWPAGERRHAAGDLADVVRGL